MSKTAAIWLAGAVAFQFDRKGQFIIDTNAVQEEVLMELALEAGAEDVLDKGDHYEVLCTLANYDALSQALSDQTIAVESSELAYLANVQVPVDDADIARKVLHLISALDALEDVKAVHSNMQLADALLNDIQD